MASIGDLKGRVVITDASRGTLQKVAADMDRVAAASKRLNVGFTQYAANLARSTQLAAQRVRQQLQPAAHAATNVTGKVRGLIEQTRGFNEAKFGYGFARLTDYIEGGSFAIDKWRVDMNRAADEARRSARDFGTLPEVAMKAREETEKLGFKGDESKSIFGAALGLHLSEPGALASGEAAKYMGAVFRAYEKQREELAKKLGVDGNDPKVKDAWIKGLAAKAAVAGAESALGPADIVEGMRQFAPQWAAMGISYEGALAALAHGSNYGFRAPELGTAFKSMATKIINPTAAGLNTLNMLGIDRSKFMQSAPTDPGKAASGLNALLSGSLYAGKGGQAVKREIRAMLDTAYQQGITATPEFQNELTNEVMGRLGHGWAGRIDEVQQAVRNATLTGNGGLDVFGLIKEMRDKGATVGQIATAFEGRHVARYTPLFQFYEKMLALQEKLQATDGTAMDAVVAGRRESEAGKTDQLWGALQNWAIKLEQTAGALDKLKQAATWTLNTSADVPGSVLGAGAAAGGGFALWRALRGGGAAAAGVEAGAAGAAAAGVAGGAAGAVAARRGIFRVIGGKLMHLVPGVGWVLTAATAAGMGYGAYQGYQETGTIGGALRGAVGISNAKAAEGGTIANGPGSPLAGQLGIDNIGSQTSGGSSDMQSVFADAAAAISSGGVDVRDALGEAADGVRAGGGEVSAAMRAAAAAITAAMASLSSAASSLGAARLNTGRAMAGSNP